MMEPLRNQGMNGSGIYRMENASLTYYHLEKDYECDYVSYDRIRLITVFSGAVEYIFSAGEVRQTSARLLLLPPYSQLHLHVVQPSCVMVLEVDDALVKSIYHNIQIRRPFNEAINNKKPCIEIRFDPQLTDCVQKIHREYTGNAENPYLVELYVCRLLYVLLNTEYSCYMVSITACHPMEQVKYYIHRHIKETIKISTLADIAGMNNSNFTNTFKRHFEKTPLEYIHYCKMAYAEELLRDHSVTDVAFDMGYENVSTFITQFKKVYHITPKQYQLAEPVS